MTREAFPDGVALLVGGSGGMGQAIIERLAEADIFHRRWADGTFDEQWRRAVPGKLCIKRRLHHRAGDGGGWGIRCLTH